MHDDCQRHTSTNTIGVNTHYSESMKIIKSHDAVINQVGRLKIVDAIWFSMEKPRPRPLPTTIVNATFCLRLYAWADTFLSLSEIRNPMIELSVEVVA